MDCPECGKPMFDQVITIPEQRRKYKEWKCAHCYLDEAGPAEWIVVRQELDYDRIYL